VEHNKAIHAERTGRKYILKCVLNNYCSVGFKFLGAVVMKSSTFWHITSVDIASASGAIKPSKKPA
jgi:predicted nucleic acid-binding Zn finger protein